jgi:hypothetical protein
VTKCWYACVEVCDQGFLQVGNFTSDHEISTDRPLVAEQFEKLPGTLRPVYEMNSTHLGMDMAAEATSAYMALSTLFATSDIALSVRSYYRFPILRQGAACWQIHLGRFMARCCTSCS